MAATAIFAASSSKRGRHRRAVMSEINVTPFVDVMLVLLIVFMVTAPLMTLSIPVELPQARGGTALNSDKEPLMFTLKKGGGGCTSTADLFLGKTPLASDAMETKLRAIKDSNGDSPTIVNFSADRDVCYKEIARVLGIFKDVGVKVQLRIVPEKEGE
jgi:biopolymer transport protein ExbD